MDVFQYEPRSVQYVMRHQFVRDAREICESWGLWMHVGSHPSFQAVPAHIKNRGIGNADEFCAVLRSAKNGVAS